VHDKNKMKFYKILRESTNNFYKTAILTKVLFLAYHFIYKNEFFKK